MLLRTPARAGADVRLLRSGDEVELTVTDNGSGFDVTSAIERGRGLGLVSIAERVRLARGTFGITAESKKGTCVRVRIPAKTLVKSDVDSGANGAVGV